MMKAAIFVEPNRIVLDEKPIPDVGPLDALIRITTTTICGTDVHILKRMRRQMDTIASGRLDTRPFVTHRFTLDQIEEAYDLFENQRDGVLKVAATAERA